MLFDALIAVRTPTGG